jgi:glycosyltransferase involved in cell wall biosynthesis
MVGDDSTLPPEDPGAWAEALGELWNDARLRRQRGEAALAHARERFGQNAYYQRLMACYRAALS